MKDVLLIGIAGGSASGKSSIAYAIKRYFKNNNSIYIIKQDDYYLNKNYLSKQERYNINYDHPSEYDFELLYQHLLLLKKRHAINKPIYDYVSYMRLNDTELIEPHDVIIIEGLYALENDAIRSLFDLGIFIDTDSDIRLIRRIKRDIAKRGRSLDSIINQYMSSVKAMHDQFVEPTKKKADIIVPRGKENKVAIDLIITKIASILK